ncbi:carbamoyl phosphate synthase large subunit [Streptomyces sp. Act143]|uniref:carbamoyl phosphate synthase preATP-grasp domain-containing protein n=1 Tax=Streptomyces sp. Act143 TaxID=2200760 RepID=UPI000D68228A|nr:carbamoyl phosphate synthase large subunit [Streptomyces sp. Act143]PWI17120.1 carbamoyl phosphate synthase large subunit [Streptomyces sp. Act143]
MPEPGTVRSVLVLGAGPQACQALTDLGLRVVLVDPDPATATTDPGFADATYVEPLTPESAEHIIARERPDALLPALDGRTAVDTAVALHEAGTLDRYGVRLLGTDAVALHRAAEVVGADTAGAGAVAGWRRYGLQLMRDRTDGIEVVCSFETFDLPGGGTITVAPARTPTTRLYEALRDVGRSVVREIGAGAGGCTLWCAVHPGSGRVVVLDVDPRGAREAALVACATGLPIAGICAELAAGRTLPETPVRSRPAPGHVAVRAVASSGAEALAVGHTFTAALQEALACLHGGGHEGAAPEMTGGRRTEVDPWLDEQLSVIRKVADELVAAPELTRELIAEAKRHGFRDRRIGELRGLREDVVRELRYALGVRSVPPMLGRDRGQDGRGPAAGRTKPAVIVLGQHGSGPAHAWLQASAALRAAGHKTVVVGCAPASPDWDERAADRFHCAPLTTEAVLEVVHAERRGGPVAGVCVQFGGADATRLARDLADQGVRVLGAPPSAVRATEEHATFQHLLRTVGLSAVRHATASSPPEAARVAAETVGYPVTVRWAGGAGGAGGGRGGRTGSGATQQLVLDAGALASLLAPRGGVGGGWPVVIGQVVRDAVEVTVDALSDGEEVYLGGVLERLGWVDAPDAGAVHVLPAVTLGGHDIECLRAATRVLAGALGVRGALTVRCALAGGVVHVRGAEPRVSGTVPFTSQATGVPLARAAARIALGASIAGLRAEGLLRGTGDGATLPPDAPVAVGQTLPRAGRTPGSGVPMDSTETPGGRDAMGIGTATGSSNAMGIGTTTGSSNAMGIGETFGTAYAKSRAAAGGPLPTKGRALLSIADRDRRSVIFPARELASLGFELLATGGLAGLLRRNGVKAGVVHTIGRTSAARLVRDGQIDLVVATHHRGEVPTEGQGVLAAALAHGVPCLTTVRDLAAAVQGIDALRRPRERARLRSLQDWQSRTTH